MTTTDPNTIATLPADTPAPVAAGQPGSIDVSAASSLRGARAFARANAAVVASVIAVVVIVAAQVVEDLADTPGLQMAPPTFVRERWTVIAVAIYALAIVGILRRQSRESLDALRPVIGCDNDRFAWYRRRMEGLRPSVELGLLAASAFVVATVVRRARTGSADCRQPHERRRSCRLHRALRSSASLAGRRSVGPGCAWSRTR